MSDIVDLAIRMTADADNAVRAADDVGDAYTRMAGDVDQATAKADASTSRMDSLAEASDGAASASSQAAGGLGDLGGALALLPGPLGGVGGALEATAPAIMGVTGASDLMNLAMRNTRIQAGLARVAMIRHAVTSRAMAVATRVAAAAQRVFNLVMRANPVVLILTLVAAAFVLAYRRSETFRNIVQGVMDRVRTAVGWVIDKVRNIPEAFQAVRERVSDVVAAVRDKLQAFIDKAGDVGSSIRDTIGGAFTWIKEHTIDPVMDAIDWILDKLDNIKLPDIPIFGRTTAAVGGSGLATSGGLFGSGDLQVTEEHVHFHGPILGSGPDELARVVEGILDRRRFATARPVIG